MARFGPFPRPEIPEDAEPLAAGRGMWYKRAQWFGVFVDPRGVAQLVAYLNGVQVVAGSSPVAPMETGSRDSREPVSHSGDGPLAVGETGVFRRPAGASAPSWRAPARTPSRGTPWRPGGCSADSQSGGRPRLDFSRQEP